MELNQRTITRLETLFAEECAIAIDTLAYHSMTDEEYRSFETCVDSFLKYDDLKQFISEDLISRAMAMVRRFQPNKQERGTWDSFRKLIKIIVKVCNEESISVLTSFLLSGKLPNHFFVLLEEMIARNIKYQEAEKTFLSLIAIQQYDRETIEKYLTIIGKDISYLTRRLLQESSYVSMGRLIRVSTVEEVRDHVVPSIMNNYMGDRTHYLTLASDIIQHAPEFSKTLFNQHWHIGPCEEHFAKYLIDYIWNRIAAVKNFSIYLQEHNPKLWIKFENNFINAAPAPLLFTFSEIPNTNKRKILIRLVELKDENSIVEFIKNFPNFSSLLPML